MITEGADPGVDVRFWGKRDGLTQPYPVICHLLDTAAVAGVLWDEMLSAQTRARICEELGMSDGDARQVVCLWAGLHDVGKVSPPFQVKVPELFAAVAADPAYADGAGAAAGERGLQHERATHWALVEFFAQSGYPEQALIGRSVGHQIAQLLGGHHGCFGDVLLKKELRNATAYEPGLGGEGWRAQRLAHAAAVRRMTGAARVPKKVLSGPTAAVVTGLVVVADWLASQADAIEPRLPGPGWKGAWGDLEAHWQGALAISPALVRDAGLGRAVFPPQPFAEQFPFKPNRLQADIAERLPALLAGPGLLLVTAPTGDGKTEAALHAASLMARASGASGLYFALPTMATADAMFKRVKRFAEHSVEGGRALTLLHSMAWLSPAYAESEEQEGGSPVLSDARSGIEAGLWLRTARRGLLAPLSNGTIDQALTAVLPVRYNVLRLLGLSGKVFVVDEAHAYDAWMHSLLVRLLEWLGALRAPVVLLSATLTGRAASSLVEAYRRGAGCPESTQVEPCYPGWLYVDAASGDVSKPRRLDSERKRDLQVETRQVRWDVKEPPEEIPLPGTRREALRTLLAPVTEQGGCVLVCCTTVEESQRTYRDLQQAFPELASREGGLRLLHSRYPAHERQRITAECETAFGKPANDQAAAAVRAPAILVATQIVEQSLDLDFDLVVSDLAPLAQLLQRAGRGKRHHRPTRPAWTGDPASPRLVVLEPLGEDGTVAAPKTWGTVYDAALLRRTSVLLGKQEGKAIAVPGDVQALVDDVYTDDFGEHLKDAAERVALARMDAARIATAAAQGQLADMVTIPAPQDVRGDLSVLSSSDPGITEELLTTRLGADTGRAVCVYVHADGSRTLDPEGTVDLPDTRGRNLRQYQIALVMRHAVPLPGRWAAGRSAEHDVPQSWASRPVLADLLLLPMRKGLDGRWTCLLGTREIEISDIGISVN